MSSSNTTRRKSSASSLDKDKLAKLQQLKMFQQGGHIASKLLKMKVTAEESAAAAISLSKVMARKKGGEVSLQLEIETEAQWKVLLRKDGLVVVEVYSGWCGPCLSMASFLKKVKVDANDDRLTLATVNSDNISDLRVFRGQSEPTWVCMGGGKPVKLIRGANSATLVATIKSEFEHELLCMENKAKRNLISLTDEAERRHKAKSEAIYLAAAQKEAELIAPGIGETTATPTPKQRSLSPQNVNDEDDGASTHEEETDLDHHNGPTPPPAKSPSPPKDPVADMIQNRLMSMLESCGVLAIQRFLLETGAVTEIKDHLRGDFTVIKERYITLDEDGVRRLFGIPSHYDELIEEEETLAQEEDGNDLMNYDPNSEVHHVENGGDTDVAGGISSKADSEAGGESTTDVKGPEGEGEEEEPVMRVKVPQYRKVPIPLPDELVGDMLLFLLESVQVVRQKEQDKDVTLAMTADDYLRSRVGPPNYQDAVDSEPNSLLAMYGREANGVGVWCPRSNEDKKYVMLNFFPQVVTDLLMPPPKEMPKYMVAIFPALFSNEIMELPELVANARDVLAQGKMTLAPRVVDRILKSRGQSGDDFEAQKKVLTGFDMFVC
ncbi:thioredoxin domain-containing protein 3 homolog isoform X3 [Folsomia candida]|uniref:thioredoxin domain-containing protein 3 homolog isoform X3 n=1 Tax=Folsomia candida TaxID=158441 RepID=UPI001604D512|nr:thioredoxin domain-containing protein 3 homolog isoform X3 [Folsomia candida]